MTKARHIQKKKKDEVLWMLFLSLAAAMQIPAIKKGDKGISQKMWLISLKIGKMGRHVVRVIVFMI